MQNILPISDSSVEQTLTPIPTEGIEQISDENLYVLCRQYGEMTRTWRDKFAGLLPEVHSRRLYEKKGYFNIYEFGAKLAGFSEAQVDTALRVERKLEGKPILLDSFHKGEISAGTFYARPRKDPCPFKDPLQQTHPRFSQREVREQVCLPWLQQTVRGNSP